MSGVGLIMGVGLSIIVSSWLPDFFDLFADSHESVHEHVGEVAVEDHCPGDGVIESEGWVLASENQLCVSN